MNRASRMLVSLLVPIALVAVWEAAARSGILPPSQSAAPSAIVTELAKLLVDPSFWGQVTRSVGRLVIGVLFGAVLGAIVGVFVAINQFARDTVSPLFGFLAGLPVVVWIPFWVMVFGLGEAFRVGLVGIATFFLIYSVSFIATRRSSRSYAEVLALFEKSPLNGLLSVYIPAVATQVMTTLRVGFALGWIILFFAEYAVAEGGNGGLGWFVANARNTGRIEQEFAGLVTLGVVAFILDFVLANLQRTMLRWSDAIEDSV